MALSDVLGSAAKNDSARQLFVWGVLYGLLSSVFEPVTTEITQEAWQAAVEGNLHRALSPELLAVMVVRGWITQGAGEAEAMKSGIAQNDFANMVNNARNPISPEEAAVALRRNIIPHDAAPGQPSFINAIREGNLGDQWAGTIQALATAIPSPADVLQAQLEGQIPAGVDAEALYKAVGGVTDDPANGVNWFELMFNTRGQAPTPNEAGVMLNRGIIPEKGTGPGAVSFDQAFLEGPWRNKWLPAWRKMIRYVPPPRTVTTLLRAGAIDVNQALKWFQAVGMDQATAEAYVASASATKATAAKRINEAAIEELYVDKAIDETQALALLQDLGYTASNAQLVLSTALLRQTRANLNRNTSRIGNYFISKKLDDTQARNLLAQLGLPGAQIDQLMEGWTIDRSANLKLLTPAQVSTAVEYGVLTEDEGLAALEADGYTPFDAWVLLSNRAKAPLPNRPTPGPAPIR